MNVKPAIDPRIGDSIGRLSVTPKSQPNASISTDIYIKSGEQSQLVEGFTFEQGIDAVRAQKYLIDPGLIAVMGGDGWLELRPVAVSAEVEQLLESGDVANAVMRSPEELFLGVVSLTQAWPNVDAPPMIESPSTVTSPSYSPEPVSDAPLIVTSPSYRPIPSGVTVEG